MKDLAKLKNKRHFKHHFLPHKELKIRANFLNHKFFYFYSLIFILFLLVVNLSKTVTPGVLGYASDIKVRELLEKTNEVRVKNGKSSLVINETLSKAAMQKAKFMFEKDFWAHTSPDGVEPWDFIIKEGYDYSYAGENLARNFYYSKEVVDAWMNSPSHKENLLSENYDEVGFAVVNGVLNGYETTLVVQMFGRPRNIENISSKESSEKYLQSLNEKSTSSEVASAKDSSIIDIPTLFRYISFSILGFVLALFFIDIYYSKKHGINKFTGHTSAHIVVIVSTILSIFILMRNGHIL